VTCWDGYSSVNLVLFISCDTVQCIDCLSHTVFNFFGRNLVGFYFDFLRVDLT